MAHYHSKKASAPVCGEPHCAIKLAGIKAGRPKQKSRLKKRQNTVSRAYGGVLCMQCTRQKYVHVMLALFYFPPFHLERAVASWMHRSFPKSQNHTERLQIECMACLF